MTTIPDHPVNKDAPLSVLRHVPTTFIPSAKLLISCGCVLVDPRAKKICIITEPANPEPDAAPGSAPALVTQLPKGRKNIGETLLDAALREAREETGFRAVACPLRIHTRATPVAVPGGTSAAEMQPEEDVDPDVTTDVLNTEPSSVTTFPCVFTGAVKMVFWFAALADSSQKPEDGGKDPWEQGLEAQWVGVDEAAGRMTLEMDAMVVSKVVEDMRRDGYDI